MTTHDPARTGIEVHAKWSDHMKDAAHLAYDVGLGWTGKAIASMWKVRLTVDRDVVADEGLFAPHIVQCLPGQHTFGVAFYSTLVGKLFTPFFEKKVTVDVEAGKITQMLYVQHRFNMNNELFALGAWSWIEPEQAPMVKIKAWDGKAYPAHALYRAQEMTMVQFPNGWRHWVDDASIQA
jgi:hypothetical protein